MAKTKEKPVAKSELVHNALKQNPKYRAIYDDLNKRSKRELIIEQVTLRAKFQQVGVDLQKLREEVEELKSYRFRFWKRKKKVKNEKPDITRGPVIPGVQQVPQAG